MDIGEFTGRSADLSRLGELIDSFEDGVPVVSIEGMAGVGKTRFAVHAAHALARKGQFDEIQLWTDLHGFDPSQPSAAPTDVLEGFLRLLGVPGDRIPRDPEERAALYRDRLAGRRGLILLDNAATEEQVWPLLPGEPGVLVLITTRHRLAGLAGVRRLPLDVFLPEDAVELLARIAGEDRIRAEPAAAQRVAGLSGYLPLLLALAARRLQARPAWTVTDLAGLIETHGHTVVEPVEGVSNAVWASIELSYRGLSSRHQRLFRVLGLHPGRDFTARSAAALVAGTVAGTERMLEQLLDEHLLQQEIAGRYRFHDLLRQYVREVALADEPSDDRDEALRRCLVWHLHVADAAVQALEPNRRRAFELEGEQAAELQPPFESDASALQWFDEERTNLVAAVDAAAAAKLTDLAWQLPAVLMRFFYRRSHWADWLATHQVALAAVQQSGNRLGEATIRNSLGSLYGDLHQFAASVEHCSRAIELFAEAGDSWGEAWSLNNVGVTSIESGNPDRGVDYLRTALPKFREVGDPQGVALCLNNLGDGYRLLDRPTKAIACLREAIRLQPESDPAARRYPLGTLGEVYSDTGQYDEAVHYYEEALETYRAVGDVRGAGRMLYRLGATLAASGRPDAARRRLREARTVLGDLGAPEAEEIEVPAPTLDQRQRRLLERIQDYMERHLADPDLSPASIAEAHHVSLRYLYQLFQSRDTTVAAWIRGQRLERCRAELADPALAERPVSAIAARWGFPNAAHFSRAFRAEYGITPGAYREQNT